MKTRFSLKYFVNDCLWKQFIDFNSPQTPLNLTSLKIFVTLRSFKQFQPKIRVIKCQKIARICINW